MVAAVLSNITNISRAVVYVAGGVNLASEIANVVIGTKYSSAEDETQKKKLEKWSGRLKVISWISAGVTIASGITNLVSSNKLAHMDGVVFSYDKGGDMIMTDVANIAVE